MYQMRYRIRNCYHNLTRPKRIVCPTKFKITPINPARVEHLPLCIPRVNLPSCKRPGRPKYRILPIWQKSHELPVLENCPASICRNVIRMLYIQSIVFELVPHASGGYDDLPSGVGNGTHEYRLSVLRSVNIGFETLEVERDSVDTDVCAGAEVSAEWIGILSWINGRDR